MAILTMNRFFHILLMITCLSGMYSCDNDLTVEPQTFDHFIKYYGKDGNQTGVKFDIHESGDFIMVGNSRFGGLSNIYVVKADPFGNEIWSKEINHLGMDIFANDIIGFQDGSSVVLFTQGGSFFPGDTPGGSVGLLRLDPNGEILQEYLYEKNPANPFEIHGDDDTGIPTLRKLEASALTYDAESDNFFICGTQNQPFWTTSFSIRVNSDFTRVPLADWLGFSIGASNPGSEVPNQMGNKIIKLATGDFGLFLTTEIKLGEEPQGSNFAFITYTPNGTIAQMKSFGTTRNEFGSDIVRIPGTNSIGMIGTSKQGNNSDMYFAKALVESDSTRLEFERLLNFGNNFEGKAIAASSNGNFIVLGEELGIGGKNIVWAMLSAGGDLLWFRKFGGQSGVGNNDLAGGVKQTPDGNFSFLGTVTLDNQQKMALFKVNTNGDLKP